VGPEAPRDFGAKRLWRRAGSIRSAGWAARNSWESDASRSIHDAHSFGRGICAVAVARPIP